MALDLDKIPPDARARYVKAGRRYSSEMTLEQANRTLNGLETHGTELLGFGFAAADATRLKDARDFLIEAGVGRQQARSHRKVTLETAIAAIKRGKAVRVRAHAIIKSIIDRAEELGLAAERHDLVAALHQTGFSGDAEEVLAAQLDLLRKIFSNKAIEKATRDRGGPATARELEAAAEALRTADFSTARVPGTPMETERLDLLDGIIVDLCRSARRSARAAARALGQPALAKAFELSILDGARTAPPVGGTDPVPTPTRPAISPA